MLWYIVFHTIGFILWMGSLLDLSRILGYHVKEEISVQERLSLMEKRMYFFVSTIGLFITLIFGILIFFAQGGFAGTLLKSGWFHAKLTLVVLVFLIHIYIGKMVISLKKEPRQISPVRFKAIHGVLGLLLVGIVILVTLKPF